MEKKTAEFAFSSVVSTKKIFKGDKLSAKNIWVKRPGKGHYKAYNFNSLLGKKAKRNISINQFIKKGDVKKNLIFNWYQSRLWKTETFNQCCKVRKNFSPIILATGMHMLKKYGNTYIEIIKDF